MPEGIAPYLLVDDGIIQSQNDARLKDAVTKFIEAHQDVLPGLKG
jgi:hypothetical protein